MIQINLPDRETIILWPVKMIRAAKDLSSPSFLICYLKDDLPARLFIRDQAVINMITEACPLLYKAEISKKLIKKTILGILLSIFTLVSVFTFFLPVSASFFANIISPKTEEALGLVTHDQVKKLFSSAAAPLELCIAPEGQQAMDRLVERVVSDIQLPYELKISVLDDRNAPQYNAFALPGGYIILFHSIIDISERPEEIAAILAHELGHVVHRDTVKGALQSSSAMIILTLLAGDFSGAGIVNLTAGQLVSSSYSRQAELQADEFARNLLQSVDLPVSALAVFFRRMRDDFGQEQDIYAHLSTHPLFGERIEETMENMPIQTGIRPVLSDVEWDEFRNICDVTAVLSRL